MLSAAAATLNRGYHYLRAVRRGGPNYLILFVTARCNLRCPHCFYLDQIESAAKERELRLDELERVARSLPALVQLTCTGGETFIREDLADIVAAFYRLSGTRFITLTTNGTLVDRTARTVEEIARRCPQAVIRVPLSLDGVGEVHDVARGKAGTWDKALACYRALRAVADRHENVRLDVTSVLSRLNEAAVEELIDFVGRELDIENHTILYARGAIRDPASIVPEVRRYQELVQRSAERRRGGYRFPLVSRGFVRLREAVEEAIVEVQRTGEMPFVCQAGERLIEMNEYGDVFPCELLDTLIAGGHADPGQSFRTSTMGNVRDHGYDVRRVLESAQGKAVRAFIQNKGCACTFECAIGASIAFEPANMGRMLRAGAGPAPAVSPRPGGRPLPIAPG